jgi:hypothetical protein
MHPRTVSVLLLLVLAGLSAPASVAAEPAADTVVVDWNRQHLGPLTEAALSRLALFQEDHPEALFHCDDHQLPQDGDLHRCAFARGESFVVGGLPLTVGVLRVPTEHDGMYAEQEHAVLTLPGEHLRVVALLDSVSKSVVDCQTQLGLRRYALADLDRDGKDELCIEKVYEAGQGLFHVLDLGRAGLPWLPITTTREISAWRLDAAGERLVEVPELAKRCPPRNYKLLATPGLFDDAVTPRVGSQGERTTLEQCPFGVADTCFSLDACAGSQAGAASVPSLSVPHTVPWGPYGKKAADDTPVGLRARVRVAHLKGSAAPTVIQGRTLLLFYEVRNFSREPMDLWHAGFWVNHRIELWRPDGAPAVPTEKGKTLFTAFAPRGLREKNVRWPVQPGGTDDTEGRYDLNELFVIDQPGAWRVRIVYEDDHVVASNDLPIWVVPQAVKVTLDKLNGWPADECDRVERPEAWPGFAGSGESAGFIGTQKEALTKAGFSVEWNPDARRYHLRSPQPTGDPPFIYFQF